VTPYQLVDRLLRSGYRLGVDASGILVVSGKVPKDPEATARLLHDRQNDVLAVLAVMGSESVEDALAELGARIVDVRLPGEVRPPVDEWCPGAALPGEPRTWRFASEFMGYLQRIGARLFLEGDSLVLVGPRDLLSQNVCAGLRCFRDSAVRAASRAAVPTVGANEAAFRT
jgi:hypothetical protein